jgi:uncharacterized protein YprB with RNaseH-like and TPR domain
MTIASESRMPPPAARLRRAVAAAFPHARWSEPRRAYGLLKHDMILREGDGASDPWPAVAEGGTLFLDLETLGFIGRPLFLIGVLQPLSRRKARLTQYLARDYAEEEAVLRAFRHRHRSHTTWVTFNGKTFDAPFLRERFHYHRLQAPDPGFHLDLLHAARRAWRGVLPDCRLKTLESHVCGTWRGEDLDGGRVPAAYHEFVLTGDPTDVVRVLEHNRHDLLTLGKLYRILKPEHP